MIDINIIRENPNLVREACKKKKSDPSLVDKFLDLDKEWRALVGDTDVLRAKKNNLGKDNIDEAKKIKDNLKEIEARLKVVENERDMVIEQIPNIPFDDVPEGRDENDNVVLREIGDKRNFSDEGFEPGDYLSLAGPLINTDKASEVAGSRFGYLLGDLVLLEFALVRLAFEKLLPHGFIPVIPPVMARPDILKAMGKIKFMEGDDAFYLPKDDLYLVGSSEHTIGPIHIGETIEAKKPPIRYIGFSTCFRREAGSYG
ncbi:MAG TPA: serine--tRNA ligase, partial [Candidatus Paceibacterota bacterium]